MRRFIGFLFISLLVVGVGFVVYAYVADLPAPVRVVETPAVGVGFSE